MRENEIKVLIVDDHPVVRRGMRHLLEVEEDLRVVAEAPDGAAGVEEARRHRPHVVLMDLVMPGMEGTEAIRKIRDVSPESRVVVLTSYHEDAMVIPAVRAGALSYLLKSAAPDTVLEAIRAAARDEPRLHPRVAEKLMQRVGGRGSSLDALTPRELEVLKAVAGGMSNRRIAEELHIAEKTVKTHVSNILSKLGLEDRTQAAIYALRQRLVPVGDPSEAS